MRGIAVLFPARKAARAALSFLLPSPLHMGGKRSQAEEEQQLEQATLNSAEVTVSEVTEVEEPPALALVLTVTTSSAPVAASNLPELIPSNLMFQSFKVYRIKPGTYKTTENSCAFPCPPEQKSSTCYALRSSANPLTEQGSFTASSQAVIIHVAAWDSD